MSMFYIVVDDNDNTKNIMQCKTCGCQHVRSIKKKVDPGNYSWAYAPVKEEEYLQCSNCGAESRTGIVPVRLGGHNFPKRNAVWDQWMCDCERTSRKAKVTYINNLSKCPKCGKGCPNAFEPVEMKEAKKAIKKVKKEKKNQDWKWEVSNPDYVGNPDAD